MCFITCGYPILKSSLCYFSQSGNRFHNLCRRPNDIITAWLHIARFLSAKILQKHLWNFEGPDLRHCWILPKMDPQGSGEERLGAEKKVFFICLAWEAAAAEPGRSLDRSSRKMPHRRNHSLCFKHKLVLLSCCCLKLITYNTARRDWGWAKLGQSCLPPCLPVPALVHSWATSRANLDWLTGKSKASRTWAVTSHH